MKARISQIRQEAQNTKTFRLDLNGTISFLPGQSIALKINDPKNNIIDQKRYYSIASSPTQPVLELLIKDNPASQVGHHIYANFALGEEIHIEGPYGKMCLTQAADTVTLIAGGSGIAPLMSILRYLADKHPETKINLFYSTKKAEEAAFLDELEDLKQRGYLSYIHTVTQEPAWKGPKGRIDKTFLEQHLPTREGIYFICGPSDMIKDVTNHLKNLGIKEEAIIVEKY